VGASVGTAVGFTLSKTLGRWAGLSVVSPAQFPQSLYILKHTRVVAIDRASENRSQEFHVIPQSHINIFRSKEDLRAIGTRRSQRMDTSQSR
jgi:hypothetical protein